MLLSPTLIEFFAAFWLSFFWHTFDIVLFLGVGTGFAKGCDYCAASTFPIPNNKKAMGKEKAFMYYYPLQQVNLSGKHLERARKMSCRYVRQLVEEANIKAQSKSQAA